MRALVLVLLAGLTLAPFAAPPAAATSCAAEPEELEPLLCSIVLLPFCIGQGYVDYGAKGVVACVKRLLS